MSEKKILQIGLGRIGLTALQEMSSTKQNNVLCLGMDINWKTLKTYSVSKRILLGKNTTLGYRALSIDEAFRAAEEDAEEIRNYIKQVAKVYIVFEMSSNDLTTLGILQMLGKIAKEEKVPVTALYIQLEEKNEEIAEMINEHMDEVIVLCDEEHLVQKPSMKKSTVISSDDILNYFDSLLNSGEIEEELIKKANCKIKDYIKE